MTDFAQTIADTVTRELTQGNDGPLTIKSAHFHEALRLAAEAGAAKASEEAQRVVSGFLGPLMGSTMALEGIADAADTLLQQNPEQGGFMLAELVTSVRLRLESATEEMELWTREGGYDAAH